MMVLCAFCGTDFDPATAQNGSLPGTVLCPTCNQQIDVPGREDSPQLPPGPPDVPPRGDWDCARRVEPPVDDRPTPPAWEGEGSVLLNLWRTIWQVLLHPGKTLSTPAPQGHGLPLGFGLIVGTLGLCFDGLWGRLLGDETWAGNLGLLLLVFSPVLVLAGLYVGAAAYHFGLWMVGGSRNGFRATFRYIAYSQSANIFLVIPVLGSLVAAVWGIVVFIVGLAGAHGIYKRQVLSSMLVLMTLFGLAAGVLMAPYLMATISRQSGGGLF